jgi:hypothetical protein
MVSWLIAALERVKNRDMTAPMFGLVPCPTTIFTFGMLLLAARPKRLLLWLPLVWSVIGFFAAVKFGIREDVGLLIAGIVTAVILLRTRPATEVVPTAEAPAQTAT